MLQNQDKLDTMYIKIILNVCIFRETCCIYNNTLYPLETVIDAVVTEDNCSLGCILVFDDERYYTTVYFRFIENAYVMKMEMG